MNRKKETFSVGNFPLDLFGQLIILVESSISWKSLPSTDRSCQGENLRWKM